MTFVLNLRSHNHCEKIYFVYNFNQIADAVLMVRYSSNLHEWDKSFLHYEYGQWATDKLSAAADIKLLNKIDHEIKRLQFINFRAQSCLRSIHQQPLTEHALLLLNACS